MRRRNPSEYRTRFGLYKAVVRVLDIENLPLSVADAWWLDSAFYHCEQFFPDLLPQLRELKSAKYTYDQLVPIDLLYRP